MDDWKKCSRCGEAKQIEDFAPRPGRRDYQAWCRECFRGYAAQWNKRRPPRKTAKAADVA